MSIKWIKAQRGLRYYEHPNRRHGKKKDRYYSIRFTVDKTEYNYGVGWLSDGIPEAIRKTEPLLGFEGYCLKLLRQYKANVKTGAGAKSPKEQRALHRARDAEEKAAAELAAKQNITFGAFMTETYLPQSKADKKERTYTIEEMLHRRYLADTIGALPFPQISAFHLERIKKDMADKGKSDRTIQYVLQLTRQVFNTARKLGVYTGENPTGAVRWPRVDNMKLRYLTVEEADQLLKALEAKSKTLHGAALLSLHCGLRFGEVAALTWGCVNWGAGTLAILNAKTGSRTAYLTEKARAMLESRKRGEPHELVFPKRSVRDAEKADTMAQASKVFSETVKELGFNKGIEDRKQRVTFHTLRHTFATHLYESTHDLYLTQRSLGHATGTMTARYAKMSENRLREGAAALEKALTKKDAGQVIPIEAAK